MNSTYKVIIDIMTVEYYRSRDAMIPTDVKYYLDRIIEDNRVTVQPHFAPVYKKSCGSIHDNIVYAEEEKRYYEELAAKTASTKDAEFCHQECQHWTQMTQILKGLEFLDD